MSAKWLLIVSVVVVAVALGSVYGYRVLWKSVIVDGPHAAAGADNREEPAATALSHREIAKKLADAGLNRDPGLGDIGVHGHMQRLQRGTVRAGTLVRYAHDLNALAARIGTQGTSIPASFWDVETPALKAAGWSPYRIVGELVQDHSKPYVDLLTNAYARFLAFRTSAVGTGDTAVDAALDIMLIARDYVNSVPQDKLLEHAPEIRTPTDAVLMVWQNLVAGTSRRNPITGKPVFSHGFLGRFNVHTIYQYDRGQAMSSGDTWGVSGFAQRLVGTPENNNQVEHLSISIILQAIMGEPLLVLNAIEEEKYLLEGARGAEASADMALNQAVHDVFLPRIDAGLEPAVEALRAELKRE